MKHRTQPGLWQEVSLVTDEHGKVTGLRFGPPLRDRQMETQYRADELELREYRYRAKSWRGRHGD